MVKPDGIVPGVIRVPHVEYPDSVVEHLEDGAVLASVCLCWWDPIHSTKFKFVSTFASAVYEERLVCNLNKKNE